MTTKPTYEFEEDEAPKPERKRFAPVPEPEAVVAPTPLTPGSAAGASAARTPGTGRSSSPGAPAAPAARQTAPTATQPTAEADDPDLKPGSRKDLWACPHCGTGNKPERTTCRSCGKAPTDAKETPAWQQPKVIGAAIGGVVLLIFIWILMKPSLALKPPGAASIDSKIRRGGAQTHARELVGKNFTPSGRLAVAGRICVARAMPGADGVITVVLLLGAGASDENLANAKVTFNNQLIDNLPDHAVVVNLITNDKLDTTPGKWLSIVGDYGDLSDPAQLVHTADQGDTVALEQFLQE